MSITVMYTCPLCSHLGEATGEYLQVVTTPNMESWAIECNNCGTLFLHDPKPIRG